MALAVTKSFSRTNGNFGDAPLDVAGLTVSYRRRKRPFRVLDDVSLSIGSGEAFGLVGESGCGKTTIAMAVMRYLPNNAVINAGRILYKGEDVLAASPARLQALRGREMAMVYQDPTSSLNPCLRIGTQLGEVFHQNDRMETKYPRDAAQDMLDKVQIADAGAVLNRFPHELSGGQQQRVMIAMALASNPGLLVLDEPTTGLDATVEAEVLDLITTLRRDFRTTILFISHNLAVVSRICERVAVLYAGQIIEEGPTRELFNEPRHPYTLALLRCLPTRGTTKRGHRLQSIPGALPPLGFQSKGCTFSPRCPLATETCLTERPPSFKLTPHRSSRCFFSYTVGDIPLVGPALPVSNALSGGDDILKVTSVTKHYGAGKTDVGALAGVSFEVRSGEIFGLVGESGSGKSTLAKCIVGLLPVSGGKITFDGADISSAARVSQRGLARKLQMIFQNPDTALNPRHNVRRILSHAVKVLDPRLLASALQTRISELAASVRLGLQYLAARPQSLSGGLKQRVAIARAFAGSPSLVVCDEPVSALDVSVQAAILNLLVDLQTVKRLSYIFISHDLGVVRYLADRIGVLYLGEIVEIGPTDAVFAPPHHPYTEALVSAMPALQIGGIDRIKLKGEIPSPMNPPSGCRFHTRCHRYLGNICKTVEPPWQLSETGNMYRCHIEPDRLASLQNLHGATAAASQ